MALDLTIAVAQVDPRVGDLRSNIEMHCERIEAAIAQGAHLVVFPELSLTGYTLRDIAWDVALNPATDPRLEPLRRLSQSIGIAFGCVVTAEDHGLYNAAVYLEQGEVRHIHHKVYLPTYGMFEEGRYFAAGRNVAAFDTAHGRLGMLVCEDMWHVALPYLVAVDGAEVILSLTASPTRVGGDPADLDNRTVNHEHHRVFARLLSVYSVFANRVGFEDGVNFWGGSAIFDPSGSMMSQAPLFDPSLIVGRLNARDIERARRFSRHMVDERPELVQRTLRRILHRP